MILGCQIFWLFSTLHFHVICNLPRHFKVIFEQHFPQTLATLIRKHFIDTLIFYKKFLSSFNSEGSFKKAHLLLVVPQLTFFNFTLNISQIYIQYFPVLFSPCTKCKKKTNELLISKGEKNTSESLVAN